MTPPPKVHIADDHQLFAEGLKAGLAEYFPISGITSDAAAILADVELHAPDVLLLDLGLGQVNGMKLIRPLLEAHPRLKIVVVTMHSDRLMADAAIKAGAHGYIAKDSGLNEVCVAIGGVFIGRRYVSPRVKPHEQAELDPAAITTGLTTRQREILLLIGEGNSSAAIASHCHVGLPTVAFHRQRIRAALGLKTEWELLRFAILARAHERI